ncbi:MAG: glycosyltransferase, partial [Clostridia bacterium]|nr:glycosyltransferase [Clostridia bacterium]
YFNDCGCEKWKDGCHDCEQKNAYPVRWLFDQSKRNYKDKKELFTAVPNMTLVTPSKWLAGIVKQSFMGVHNVKVVNNGVDQKIFGPTKGDFRKRYDIVDKRMILGVASPWSRRKGLDDFITLSEMLDDSYRIVLVGLNDKQLSALPGNINGISRTENVHQLAEIYTTADVFVNPTYEDNFPTVNIEAISCGTPVVTYDTGGSGEVADDTCGCIVPCGDIDALAQAARTFTAPAEACLERAKKYSIPAFCEQYLDIYNSLIG